MCCSMLFSKVSGISVNALAHKSTQLIFCGTFYNLSLCDLNVQSATLVYDSFPTSQLFTTTVHVTTSFDE